MGRSSRPFEGAILLVSAGGSTGLVLEVEVTRGSLNVAAGFDSFSGMGAMRGAGFIFEYFVNEER